MYQLFFYIALFIGIVPFLALVYKGNTFAFKHPGVPFVWVTAVATLYEYIGTVLLQIETAYWFQVYSLIEFSALYYFFFSLLKTQHKHLYKAFLVVFIIVYGISFFYWDEVLSTYNIINSSFLTLFVLISIFLWFKDLFREKVITYLWKNTEFYFISGFAIYYASTYLFFLLDDLIFNSDLYYYDYSLVNVLATFVLRAFLTIGVWTMNRN